MKRSTIGCAALLLATVAAFSATGAKLSSSVPKGWGEDFELAKKTAAAEGKHVFLAFSGSDWCGWCVKLDREVYSQKAFVEKAKGKFVLTMIDCPQNQEILSKLAQKQNKELARQFGVSGYPTGVVCDGEGKEVGRIGGFVKGGPDAYFERMMALIGDRTGQPAAGGGAKAAEETFASEVLKGEAILKASEKDAPALAKLTERKTAANKAAILKIEAAVKAMTAAKTAAAAKRAVAGFESAVKAYHKKYVGDYGKWPLSPGELARARSATAKAAVGAMESAVSSVSAEEVKAVYQKKLEAMRAEAETALP